MTRLAILILAAISLGAPALAQSQPSPLKVAVFRFEYIDRSGADSATAEVEGRRLDLVTDYVRRKFEESDRYELVDVAAVGELDDKRLADPAIEGYLSECEGCEAEIAAALGAELSLFGVVTRVTGLVLTVNVLVHDAKTGQLTAVHGVNIRGNSDTSWMRGISWLVRNRLFKETGG
ncbi:MAG: DUF3280 domain-containing protein [Alphaproteobacteria bacterium]